ncbi:MAG: hypothetical protein Q7J80_12900 [Anaerolineales bacterium]|nr:hypothetical protein [Anaerolineales bacterium]
MKKNMIFIVLAALLLPGALRLLWFYRGIPSRPDFATPDYQSLAAPQPPIETSAGDTEDIKQMGGIVLLDLIHGNQFQPSDITSLSDQIEKRGGRIELLNDYTLLETKLKYASAFMVISPAYSYASEEIRLIQAFVNRGGKLMVFTDATRNYINFDYITGNATAYGDANSVNPLLASFGITVNNDYLYDTGKNEGNFRNIFFDKFGKNEMTFGLKEVTFYGTHSIKTSSGLILLRGAESTLSSINDANDPAAGGAALSQDKNVAVFGDFTFLTSPYNNYSNNPTLIANLADFALSGKQEVTLASFPYVYKSNLVQVYITSELQITPELISALGRLQSSLQTINIKMEIVDKAPSEGDAIILGTFTPSDDLTPFTETFDLAFNDEDDTVTVPDLGNVSRTGNGLILFDHGKKGTRITLLADTQENLISLLDIVGSGYLYGCVLQNDVGVCGVGYSDSGDYYFGDSTENFIATETTTTENAITTPTPIP